MDVNELRGLITLMAVIAFAKSISSLISANRTAANPQMTPMPTSVMSNRYSTNTDPLFSRQSR